MTNDFDELLEELRASTESGKTLLKALPEATDTSDDGMGDPKKDDKKIKAAAADGKKNSEADMDDGTDAGDGEMFGKSFAIKLADGTEVEGVDGTQILKSLSGKVEKHGDMIATGFKAVMKAIEARDEVVSGQTALIKSLQDQVASLRRSGSGRVAVLAQSDNTQPRQQQQTNTFSMDEFGRVALKAQREGRVSSLEVSIGESRLMKGLPLDEDFVSRLNPSR